MEAVQNDYQNTVLGKIPADWKLVKLGEIVDFYNSKRKPVKENKRKPGIYPYYGASGIIDYVDDYIFEGDYILLAEDGANILTRSTPIAFRISGKTWVNNHAHVLKPKLETDINYLTYYLESINYEKYNSGTAQPKLNRKVCETIDIAFPSIREREEIGEILSTWDKAIELKEKLIEQKKEQKKGLMQKLLTGEVRFPGFYEKWEKRQIGELITESKVIADEPDLNKRITVRLNLKGVQKREVTSVEKENVTTQYVRRAGQFIYGKQNLYKGAIGIVPEELDGFQSSSDIPSFDFNSDVDGLWFYYYFSRESFYSYLEVISTGTGSKRVNPKDLFRIKINVPPLDEQRQISKILLSQDQEIKLLEKELKALKMQKKGLMQLLLTGKIRVKV